MNPDIQKLHPYPFERLTALKSGITPVDKPHIALSIGEPRHAPPDFVLPELARQISRLGSYPVSRGINELREVIARWLTARFRLPADAIDPGHQVLPVNGTREALFAFAQAVVNRANKPLVVMPNPFYQIYEGAALLAGAEPYFLNTTAKTGYLPDLDSVPADIWQRCQLIYICTPGNPTGAVMDIATLQKLITLAEKYDFVIASDECYSEIYFDENQPPPGLLQAAAEMGAEEFDRCVVFHSLSKRSNVPGLRSGFVAGGREIIRQFLLYRTYHGCAMPEFTQYTSIGLWQDEQHVRQNRELYREKFSEVIKILGDTLPVTLPQAAFYLWPDTPGSDETFARQLFQQQNVTVLPGSYLSRDTQNGNPGSNHVRIALVAGMDECVDAAMRIKEFVSTL